MFKYILVASAIAAVSYAAAINPDVAISPEVAISPSTEVNPDAIINGAQFKLLTVCTAANFKGSCIQFVGNLNTCYILDDYNDSVSSARVDDKNIHCRMFRDDGCTGENMLIDRPYKNFQDVTFNDMASTFKCWFA
jgi:hypothetical protein